MTDLLTTRQVADRLGLSPETVLRWARAGRLPAVYLSSRAIRFDEAAVDEWLKQRTRCIVGDTPKKWPGDAQTPPAVTGT